MKRLSESVWRITLAISCLVLFFALLLSADLGQAPVRLFAVVHSWIERQPPPSALESTLVDLRMKRGLMALLAGAALALAGCGLQALLRNPLADPYVLGVSGGASLGAVLAMAWSTYGSSNWLLPTGSGLVMAGATTGALMAVYLVYGIASRQGRLEVRSMILAGVVLQVFLGAVVLMIWTLLDRSVVNAHIQWLTGRIPDPPERAGLVWMAVVAFLGWLGLRLLAVPFNALGSGEEGATELGIDVEKIKRRTFFLASLITGIAVSICGLIGFVGLIVPHAMRLLIGPDHRRLVTASALGGAFFLLVCDTIARAAFGSISMPVGAITALAGAPFFLYLLSRSNKNGMP